MPRELRKYPSNRRLYDPVLHGYTKLAGVAEVVLSGEGVHVTDAKSGADVTTSVLWEVLHAKETACPSISAKTLHDLIRNGEPK